MKKIIALVLSLMMLFCAAAVAETAEKTELGKLNVKGKFIIKTGELPDGYKMEDLQEDELGLTALFDAPDKPGMILSITFDDHFGEVERLNDLDEDSMEWLKTTWTEEFDNVEFDTTETAYGTKLLVVRIHFDDGSMVGSIYTIYKGYQLEIDILPDGTDVVTEESVQAVVKYLSDMDFVPVEE